MTGVPCIDIGPFLFGNARDRRAVAQAWGRAFEEVGFATIVGHGIGEDVAARAYNAVTEFFALPLGAKMRWAVAERVKTRGYLPVGIESVARTRGDDKPPDLCEALVFAGIQLEPAAPAPGTKSMATGNVFPAEPHDLTDAVCAYYNAVYALNGALMQLSALALDLPEDFFAASIDRRRGTLRCVFYPDQADEPQPGQLRYGAHSDYGGLTILRQDEAPGGLQVLSRGGAWIDVRPVQRSFVINVGDLMARWTNDRWRSTLHRVINPPRDATGSTQRLSLVLFSGPNDDAVISCLPTCADARTPAKYPPVRAGEYIRQKLDASMPETLMVDSAAERAAV